MFSAKHIKLLPDTTFSCSIITSSEINITKNKILKIFPNPATSEINISIENINEYEISVFNILGEKQKTETGKSVISVSELASGIYFITARSKGGVTYFSQKIIKN